MLQHAGQLGANRRGRRRYDATEIMQGVTEVLAYGTAVVVERSASWSEATKIKNFLTLRPVER